MFMAPLDHPAITHAVYTTMPTPLPQPCHIILRAWVDHTILIKRASHDSPNEFEERIPQCHNDCVYKLLR